MAESQKPQPDIVTVAARAMTHPHLVTREDITRMAARILDDERSDPIANGPGSLECLASQSARPEADLRG